MKLVLIFSLFSINSFAFECSKNETQFIGVIAEKQVIQENKKCSFKIDFHKIQNSILCPIEINELVQARFTQDTCSFENGQQVSGYLTQDIDTKEITID